MEPVTASIALQNAGFQQETAFCNVDRQAHEGACNTGGRGLVPLKYLV